MPLIRPVSRRLRIGSRLEAADFYGPRADPSPDGATRADSRLGELGAN
jgi:hypothetical protein